jgi:hypothetical protein
MEDQMKFIASITDHFGLKCELLDDGDVLWLYSGGADHLCFEREDVIKLRDALEKWLAKGVTETTKADLPAMPRRAVEAAPDKSPVGFETDPNREAEVPS